MYKIFLKHKTVFFIVCMLMSLSYPLTAQNKLDSLTEDIKNEMFMRLKHFTFGFYIDAYYNGTLKSKDDTSNVVPFSSNCPVQNQIRLNVAAIEIGYTADKVRGKLAIQFGDAPNLLAAPQAQFIKNLRQANFGFRLSKKLWLDFGYFLNPVGIESSWPVLNYLSTVSVGGYYEPGSVLGVKLTWNASEKFWGGIMIGNPYSLAYAKNTHMAGLMFVYYKPIPRLTLNYNNFFGNQALIDADIDNNILYNNLIVTYNPFDQLFITGQFDFAAQTNSGIKPDTTETATMFSGMIQAKYTFLKKYSVSGRYEFFNDYDGFLSGLYYYNNQWRGLMIQGFTVGFEYKPIKIGYIRLEYRHLFADHGNYVFQSMGSDQLQSVVFTTGVRF
ncbi:MAG: outer membrane beta-barrel protein [Bacteroidetes bacterium]|nr:outer membrane beta-barrel protein [Bacteroidota bacterium]